MDNDDWDLFSIMHICNINTFTTPATISETLTPPQILTTTTINNIISPQSTTPSCYDDFTFIQENNAISFAPLKPNDFIELNKLMINSNPTTIIPNPASTSIQKIITTTISSPTTTTIIPTPWTTTTPTHITNNINTSVLTSNWNSTFFHFQTLIEQQQMQPNEFTEIENANKWDAKTTRSYLFASGKWRASSKATASLSKTVIFARCYFVRARINCPRESLTQHAKDVIWLRSWNAASTLHFNHVSLDFSQTELLLCTILCLCCTTVGEGCLWTFCHCFHSVVLPMRVEVWWASFQMTPLRATQTCQRSKATRPAMSQLSDRHI